jgi:Leucine-rich repeat (LRR) protein
MSCHFQTISERAFDGLNNLERLNLENNRLKTLERGLFTEMPALTYLNLMRNSLETVTLHTIQPLMNNLVNHTTSMLLIKGNFAPSPFNPLCVLSNFAGSSIKSPLISPREFMIKKRDSSSVLIIFTIKQF